MTEVEEMNPFELQRQQLIARNRAHLLALGIPEAVSGLSKFAPKQAPAPSKRKQPKPKNTEPAAPSRQSNRLRDQALIARGEVPPDVEAGSELGMFIIDGECPRCGRVLSSGHARHLQHCKGQPEPPTEEEIAAQAEAYKSQQKEKLRQLELGGLVDFSTGSSLQARHQEAAAAAEAAADEPPKKRQRGEAAAAAAAAEQEAAVGADEQQQQQQRKRKGKKAAKGRGKTAAAADAAAAGGGGGEAFATFIVIGSTGNHYVVRLTDAKRSCTCMDHRIRRRDCKHIRLIWEQLGVADDPAAWQQAVALKVSELAAADASDVAMVHQAEARRAARQQKAAAAAAAES